MPRKGVRPSGRPAPGVARVVRLIRRLEQLRSSLLEAEARVPLYAFGASHESARNLVHYLALRRFDLRRAQGELELLGVSSLGRSEGHVMDNLQQVLARLRAMIGRPAQPDPIRAPVDPVRARQILANNATRLFGPPRPGRGTRIMVTAPSEAARDPGLVRELLASGMDCLRINCAHDSAEDRARMVDILRVAQRGSRRRCRVEIDLGGPRLRTGPLRPGPAVLKVRPERDEFGHVLHPARLHLVGAPSPSEAAAALLPELVVATRWLERRKPGEPVSFRDARGSRRQLRLLTRTTDGWVASLDRTAYLTNGLRMDARGPRGRIDSCSLAGIAPRPGRIRLTIGSELRLLTSPESGGVGRSTARHRSLPRIGVTIPAALRNVRVGDQVAFDGGRISGVFRSVSPTGHVVTITSTPAGGAWLRADQGVNLPDTELGLPSLSDQDLADLPLAVRQADLIGYSFVQSAADVARLRHELRRLGHPRMGVVLKIETRRAFDRLPEILLAALRDGPSGVMLARGDLAVEVGFERLSEVQEEILWLCEAAHLPTVWATQVLEGLAKGGVPSRAEVTDAAMGERAECVMLNKGPYLVDAVRALDSIVRRMQAHQAKKSARMRHLAVAERFLREVSPQAPSTLVFSVRK